MFCKHKWKVLSDTTHESAMERAARIGARVMTHAPRMLTGTHVVILTCDVCGETKKLVTEV